MGIIIGYVNVHIISIGLLIVQFVFINKGNQWTDDVGFDPISHLST